jgi:hypothetical protein
VQVLFTPHLVPMNRGILATCYARPAGHRVPSPRGVVMEVLHEAYDDEPFVHVTTAPPSTKATLGSNAAHVTGRGDERTGWVMALCAHRQPGQGCRGWRRAGRQRGARPSRDTAWRRWGCTRERRRAAAKADVLVEALPYIRRFDGAVVVVKYGGNALAGSSESDRPWPCSPRTSCHHASRRDAAGRGARWRPQISELMARLGKETEFRDGLRVTDNETVDIAAWS